MKFIITVDAESGNQWGRDEDLTTENIRYLPRFQKLCEKYNFIPTYLITYEVAVDDFAIGLLGKWQNEQKAEIGAHLHPWTNPPFGDGKERRHAFPSQLAVEELRAKIGELTRMIEKKFGKRPTSYRAGRWGFDVEQVGVLSELGYSVDCSVTPKKSWKNDIKHSGGIGGPDFRSAPAYPYYLSTDSVIPAKAGIQKNHVVDSRLRGNDNEGRGKNNELLEVPLTIIYTGIIGENSLPAKLFSRIPDSFLKRVLNKLFFQEKQLRIFQSSKASDWKKIHKAAVKNKFPVLEFMIHSSELMPGQTPYAKNEEEVEYIYNQLEEMFKYFKAQNLEGAGLSDFAKNYHS